eukprot:6136962-Amphidinium_carterae.1
MVVHKSGNLSKARSIMEVSKSGPQKAATKASSDWTQACCQAVGIRPYTPHHGTKLHDKFNKSHRRKKPNNVSQRVKHVKLCKLILLSHAIRTISSTHSPSTATTCTRSSHLDACKKQHSRL